MKRQHRGFLKLDSVALNAWLVVCVECLSLEAYYVGMPYFMLSQESVIVLPERYILDRWRKEIKRKHTYISTCINDVQHNLVLERYKKLHRLKINVLEIGAESVENCNVLEELLIDLKDNFPRSCDKHPLPQRNNSVRALPQLMFLGLKL
jgi:hypothetical protein